MKYLFAFTFLAGISTVAMGQSYQLPNDDAGCPANCRVVPWLAGSDIWNGGVLPVYPVSTTSPNAANGGGCTGLTEGNGTTDNSAAINACMTATTSGKAVLIPPGMYYVNTNISIPSNKVLRGSGSSNCSQGTWLSPTFGGDIGPSSTCTTLKYGPNGALKNTGSFSRGSINLLASGYIKGSTSVVTTTAPVVAVNDWIIVGQKQGSTDPPVTWNGGFGNCTWCGENDNTQYIMTQIVQVTSVVGNTIGISRPLYYTFDPAFLPNIMKIVTAATRMGIENIKLWGPGAGRNDAHINLSGCIECWVKGVETYHTPNVAKAYPIYIEFSYGAEIRESYFHFGDGNSSDRNYGLGVFDPNSDHKVENNIYRENRHSFSYEGGGSGLVFLYNYVDDEHTDDLTYLGASYSNHGGHPYMNLFEGNVISHFVADNFWGSSSHTVLFRNWLWGDETGNFIGFNNNGCPGPNCGQPNYGFAALEIGNYQTYYSAVGNVLGITSLHTTWSTGIALNANCTGINTQRSTPYAYLFGCDSSSQGAPFQANVRSTAILHGNYDYKTVGVAFWDGGANHTLANSIYYASKPAFFGSMPWPAFGPDLTPVAGTIPAQSCYTTPSSCYTQALAGPVVTLAPGSLTFSAQTAYTTSTGQGIVLTNTGTAVLAITTIALGGANSGDYAISANTCPVGSNLGIGASCTVTVTFTPLGSGSRTASVVFTNNAAGSPQSIPLAGTGVAPTIYRPTTFVDTGTDVGGAGTNPFTNPGFGFDGNLSTLARGGASNTGGGQTTINIVYKGFLANVSPSAVAILVIRDSAIVSATTTDLRLSVSLNNGASFTPIWCCTSRSSLTPADEGFPAMEYILLPPGQDFTQVQVQMGASFCTTLGCTLSADLWETWIQIGSGASLLPGGNLISGGNVLQ